MHVTVGDCASIIGRELHSEVKEDLVIDKEARLCNVTNPCCLSWYHYQDLLCMQAGERVVLYVKLNTKLSNVCAGLLSKPFDGKPWSAVKV